MQGLLNNNLSRLPIMFIYIVIIHPAHPLFHRNQAMGIASVGGRLGNMLAPFSNLVVSDISLALFEVIKAKSRI